MKKRLRRSQLVQIYRWLVFSGLILVLMASGIGIIRDLSQAVYVPRVPATRPTQLNADYIALVAQAKQLTERQAQLQATLITDHELNDLLSQVQLNIADGNTASARQQIKAAMASLTGWNRQLDQVAEQRSSASSLEGARFLPILLYHYLPANFEQHLQHLQVRGYTVIDLDEARQGLAGGPLPPKPVVITYDDGFADQLRAFELLKKYGMKATFYIINGSSTSQWCIGAGRRYNDPLQPPQGCGDAYMNWDAVRLLDRSGLISIGGHTMDHLNLAALPPDQQRHEIADSKAEIERELGHPIRHFAYPYGAYNAAGITAVREAGYQTAVTTVPGEYQPQGSDFTLRRMRDALLLP